MSLGKSDPPPAPDYAAAARAQGGANLQATIASNLLNRPNEVTPLGSRDWRQQGQYTIPAAEGNPAVQIPLWQSRINLTPEGQSRFEQEQRIIGSLGGIAEGGLGRVGTGMGQPFDMSDVRGRGMLPQALQGAQQGGGMAGQEMQQGPGGISPEQLSALGLRQGQTGVGGLYYPTVSSGLDPAMQQEFTRGVSMDRLNELYPSQAQGTQQQGGGAGAGGVQQYAGLPGLPSPSALPGVTQIPGQNQVGDALYRQQTRYMDPQYQDRQQAMETQLINQGLRPGTEAYDKASRNFSMDRERAYADARDRAILASGQEQSRQFGLGAQQFGQGLARGAQEFGQGAQAFGLGLAGQGQQFGQQAQGFGLGQQARQQDIAEQAYLRGLPLNELNALRSGAQVQMPQFQPFSTANMQPAPLFNATMAQGQAAQNAYNAGQAQDASFMQGLFGLGGAMFGAPALGGTPWWFKP